MTPAAVTIISQTLPLISAAKSNPSPRQKTVSPPDIRAVSTKESKHVPVDSVSISQQTHQAIINVKKEEPKKVDGQEQDVNKVNNSEKSNSSIPQVQYVYDLKGNLIINYMDSNNKLIYQVPTELNLYLKEAAAKSGSSVDMKA